MFAFFTWLTLLLASARVQPAETGAAPLWTADLVPFSYAARPNPHYIGGKSYIGGKFADIGVIFRSPDEVICYFVTKPTGGQLEQRGKLQTSDPFRLQIISFAGNSGVLKYRKELAARSGTSSVMVGTEDKLIIRTGEFLRLYGSDFSTIKERLLSSGEHEGWTLRQSPTTKTLGLAHYNRPFEQFEVLSSASLSLLGSRQNDRLLPLFSISDTGLVKPDPQQRRILIRDFGSGWRILPGSSSLPCVSNPVFINDRALLNACGHEVVLLSTSGDVLMRDVVEKDEHLEELASVTPDGRFLAVSAMRTRGGFMDYTSIKRSSTKILVYDTASGKRISNIQLDSIPQKDYDFALAPDGSKLAVMIDNQLKVYVIAPQKKPGKTADSRSEGSELRAPTIPVQVLESSNEPLLACRCAATAK